jgi:hypothetical protein
VAIAWVIALAVHFADNVMQQHIRRSGRIGAGEIADDRIEPEHRLDRVGLKPVIEHLACTLGEQIEQIAALREREPSQLAAYLPKAQPLAGAATDVSRRLEQERAQDDRDAIKHRVVRRQCGRISGRVARNCLLGGGKSAAHLEVTAARKRQEVGQWPLDDRQPVLHQLEIVDYLRVE